MNDRSDISAHQRIFGTTTNPCPPWCNLPAGHGYDSEDTHARFRSHEREIGHLHEPSVGDGDVTVSVHVTITSLEALRVTGDGVDVAQVGPPHIVVECNGNNMSAGHARNVARMLVQAADELDEATRS